MNRMKKMNIGFLGAVIGALSVPALAHDTWVETNTNIYRVGDVAHIDLKLGNHGNEHRDFKLASKLAPEMCALQVIGPDGRKFDLKSDLIDTGYSPKEGFWTAAFTNDKAGLYTVVSTMDAVMDYAPERAVKSAKTFFLASRSLDRVPSNAPGFDRKLGLPLELVPESNPVTPMGPGMPLKLRLYFKGKPLPGVKVSFIPEGETLKGELDPRYEAKTNVNGRVSFTPKEAKRYLVAVHYQTPEKGKSADGKSYDFTLYGATLELYVPAICPCCG
jgi:uncharacterized GH25 family protein